MNFSLSGDEQIIDDVSLYSKCQLGKGVNAKPFSDKIRVITIDMRAFNKKESNCKTTLEKWIYNIKNMEDMSTMPFKDKNFIFEHLETLSDYYAMEPAFRKLYDSALRRSRDYYSTIENAKVEGRAQGISEGRQRASYELAKKLILKGMSSEEVSDLMDLQLQELGLL